jgi:RNA polymerase sigma factor (sigma-70 family)
MTNEKNSLSTRSSLLRRVKNESEETKWQLAWEDFYSIYRPLVIGVARRAGLNAEEAEDVLQDVMGELRRRIQGFEPDRKRGPFKAWLLNLVRWRIKDQIRKRPVRAEVNTASAPDALHLVAQEPTSDCSEEEWDRAYHQRLLEQALEKVRNKADETQFQIFRICTSQKIKAQKVAETFGVSVVQVYLAKHRVSKLIKREVQRMDKATNREFGLT